MLPAGQSGEGHGYLIEDFVADHYIFTETYYRKNGKPTLELRNIRNATQPFLGLYG